MGGGGVHIGARALLYIYLIWFGYIVRLSGGDILLVQLISTCRRGLGGGGQHPVPRSPLLCTKYVLNPQFNFVKSSVWMHAGGNGVLEKVSPYSLLNFRHV
jgi:hypothetical protein